MGQLSLSLDNKPRRDFSTAQLKLIRRTLARGCSDAEFDEFIMVSAQCGLDPLRRQITPLILNADDPDRRRLIPWATIDGLRVIAARQGDYRPMETAPLIEQDEARIDADRNPLGIARAEVRAWKASDGVWHPVAGEAWWDEYAPLKEDRAAGREGERPAPAKMILEPSWRRMGRVMIAKCAEAQALRRGWPDLLSGLYGEEELHALKCAEETASERLSHGSHVGPNDAGRHVAWFAFDPSEGLVAIPRVEIASRLRAFLEAAASTEAIAEFQASNRQSLALFWDWAPAEAMELKILAERRSAELAATPPRRKGAKRARLSSAPSRPARLKGEVAHEDAAPPKT